jgi:amino acid adenylation domain-containing protein
LTWRILMTFRSSICEATMKLGYTSPDSIALEYGDLVLSYEELDLRADRFAGYLTQLGVMPDSTVAICMDRSFDWIIAALGTMRVGAAYVPLDSAWPDSRLRFALEDSGAAVLVAPTALLDRLATTARGIDPSRDAAVIATTPRLEPRSVRPESLAYVIYTSGSTGVPKGVEITHANLAHLIRWHLDAFKVTQHDRASHLAGLGFDAAVWEIWPYLLAGATICLADDAVRSSPELMQQWIIRERVTIGFVPTVHAGAMMTMEWPATTKLRYLLTGGDTLHHAPASHLPFEVVNNYGPTECTVVSTFSVLRPEATGTPSIGRAITGAKVYLLDERGERVADGEVGEIYIGGNGVGRGYRNLPDATGKSFLPDPFAGVPDARMYRSGDRGVLRADGEIEFRGRLDRQAKIRGQRIELDEIGGILNQHPDVNFAVATVNSSEEGENQLVAYVLPKEGGIAPSARDLQEFLLHSLPQYMVPAIFVKLEALPLSPSGKLDLKMLPNPAAALLRRETARSADGPIEERLLSLVRELLQNDAITAEDNFFLAGGHSLLGMQLVMRLRKAFDVAFTLRQLFEAPTVETLALLIETKLTEKRLCAIWMGLLGQEKIALDANFFDLGGNGALVAALQRRIIAEFGRRITIDEFHKHSTVRQQAELIHGNLRTKLSLPPGVLALQPKGDRNSFFWVHYPCENLAEAMGQNRPFLFVTLTDEDLASLGNGPPLRNIATCLMRKILATQQKGPYTLGGFCIGGVLAYEIACQMRAGGHEVSLLVLLDTPSPLYYRSPYLLAPRLSQAQYLMKRVTQLGLRVSFLNLRERLSKRFPHTANKAVVKPEFDPVQESDPVQKMIEFAASQYQPETYDGKVVMLLASGHPPHVDFLPGWQSLIPQNLQTQYEQGQHLELTQAPAVHRVADAINAHLITCVEDRIAPTERVDSGRIDPANGPASAPKISGATPQQNAFDGGDNDEGFRCNLDDRS